MAVIQVDRIVNGDPARARLAHDAKYDSGAAFINGKYCSLSEASIPLFDAGFVHCDAVYEKATVSLGRYFRLQDHLERFARSCAKFRLTNPCTDQQMVEIFDTLIRLGGFKEAGMFWCVTRGFITKASDRNNPAAADCRFYAAVSPYTSIATPEQRMRGLDLWISEEHMRIPPRAVDPTAKSFHWMDMKLSLFEARDRGKDWSVLVDAEEYLTEAPGANIFVIKNGEIYTPDSGCLEGITRQVALELAQMLGIPTHVEKVHARQLRQADDAFITSSAGGIMPVNSVDGIVLGGTAGPGELATRLHNLYWEKMWEGWKGTPVSYDSARSSVVGSD